MARMSYADKPTHAYEPDSDGKVWLNGMRPGVKFQFEGKWYQKDSHSNHTDPRKIDHIPCLDNEGEVHWIDSAARVKPHKHYKYELFPEPQADGVP